MKPLPEALEVPPPALAVLGVVLLLASLGVRLFTGSDLSPGFAGDPLVMGSPIIGLTPSWALACDAGTILGAGLILLAQSLRHLSPRWWEMSLFGLGAVGVILQVFLRPNWYTDALLGTSWISAMIAGLGASAASRDKTLRVWLFAGLLSMLPLLAIRGGIQVYIEQPETYRAFLADKARILDSHGWTTDSPMARAYERRVSQPEATAWFGLANVLSTLMASGAIAFAGLALIRRSIAPRDIASDPFRRTWFAGSLIGCGVCVAGVLWAGSKGGVVLLAGGMLLLGIWRGMEGRVGTGARLWRQLLPAIGPLAILGPALAVGVRGALGERLGELSLLFRSFYQQGALRVFASHPWLGVGPGGFKDAYLLAKPAIAPEDVSSPHCLLLDHAATLGIWGVAWVALWSAWAASAGRSLTSGGSPGAHAEAGPWSPMRPHLRVIGGSLAIAVLASSFLEAPITTPEMTAARLGGLLLGLIAAGGAIRFSQARPDLVRGVAAVAGLGAIAHCQIELSGVTPGGATWVMVLLAGAGGSGSVGPSERPRRHLIGMALGAMLLGLILPGWAFGRVWRYESSLRTAYDLVSPFRELSSRLRVLSLGPVKDDSIARLDRDLRLAQEDLAQKFKAAGHAPPGAPRSREMALAQVQAMAASLGWEALGRAWLPNPESGPNVASQAMSRLMVTESQAREQCARLGAPMRPSPLGASSDSLVEAAIALAARTTRVQPSAEAFGWMGTLCEGIRQGGSNIPGLQQRRLDAFRRASLLAPRSAIYPAQAALSALGLGDQTAAKQWAELALENNARLYLDPLAGLPESVLVQLEQIRLGGARGSDQSPIKSPSSPEGRP